VHLFTLAFILTKGARSLRARCTSHSAAGNFFLRIESALRTPALTWTHREIGPVHFCAQIFADCDCNDCNGTKVTMRIKRLKVIMLWVKVLMYGNFEGFDEKK
jgi:hypothetical protein